MGIKHVWTILNPFCERKPLYELQGKTVAVDLSCWICEAQNITEYQVQPRMYLRNLYFRTCYLLLLGVNPVFILEGKAPELKYDTIAARNVQQFKGAKPKTDKIKTGKDRSRFNFILKRCEEMLDLMGLSCIRGNGEAECLCAYLNNKGLVDGCISQDSDCFAYGAKVVYRNFSIASQGGGSVDIYDMAKVEENINFGRNKIIATALLCGSDYSDGVQGVGKESVLKFFQDLSDNETLDRLRKWRTDPIYDKYEDTLSDKNICTSCGHHGKVRLHNQNGCKSCGMTTGCSNTQYKEERLKMKNELLMRSKALEDANFPDENLINEFLLHRENVFKLELEWKQPKITQFVRFTSKFLEWEEIYGFEKVVPILTRWQCLNYKCIGTKSLKGVLNPSHIKKKRNPKGVPSYEIVWSDLQENLSDVIPKQQIEGSNTSLEAILTTIEPQELVDKAYPDLVDVFQQSKIKPKKLTRRRKKVDEDEQMLKNTSITEPTTKKTRKMIKKKTTASKEHLKELQNSFSELALSKREPPVLDNFVKKSVINNKPKEVDDEMIDLYNSNMHTSTPYKSSMHVMDISCFGDEENDSDLSDIVEKIISHKPYAVQDKLTKIGHIINGIHEEKPKVENIVKVDLEIIKNEQISDERQNSSSFFISEPVENDLFESTFKKIDDNEDNDSTIEYDYNENGSLHNSTDDDQDHNTAEVTQNTSKDEKKEDSFCTDFIPLIERLKTKK